MGVPYVLAFFFLYLFWIWFLNKMCGDKKGVRSVVLYFAFSVYFILNIHLFTFDLWKGKIGSGTKSVR